MQFTSLEARIKIDGLWITSEKREGTQYDETHQRKNFYIPITLILYELGSLDLAWKQK